MAQITLGRIEVFFRQDPSEPQRSPAQDRSSRLKRQKVSLQEAQEMAGYRLWQPAYLPFAGMTLENVEVFGNEEAFDTVILKYGRDSAHWLVITQQLISRGSGLRRIPIPFRLREGLINNRPAAFFTFVVTALTQPGGQLELLSCLWEHDDFLMELQAPHISDQVARQIAESLQ